jgi:hypothetical protein
MSRLLVTAVSGESKFLDIVFHLELFVCVVDANTGEPITGLLADHFRLCSPVGMVYGSVISACTEATWNPQNTEGAGCYSLNIAVSKDVEKQKLEWMEGEFYTFGIQARYTDESQATHIGQTVVRVQSLGK